MKAYHVHKYVLAHGKQRSEYFSKLFRSGIYNESQASTSRIELDPLAAKVFPALLDYVYEPDRPLKISTDSATALHYLGEYFDMRHLRWDAMQFYKTNISLENVHIYYDHATLFHGEAFLHIISEFLGENIMKLDTSSPILQKSNPQLWERTLDFVANSGDRAVSNHVSKLVAELIAYQEQEALGAQAFHALTEQSKIPCIHPDAALTLCELEDEILPWTINSANNDVIFEEDDDDKTRIADLGKRSSESL